MLPYPDDDGGGGGVPAVGQRQLGCPTHNRIEASLGSADLLPKAVSDRLEDAAVLSSLYWRRPPRFTLGWSTSVASTRRIDTLFQDFRDDVAFEQIWNRGYDTKLCVPIDTSCALRIGREKKK